jgi:hypothetical protein
VTHLDFGLMAAALLPSSGKCLAIAVVDPHEGIAPCIVLPAERRLGRRPRHPGMLQQVQGASHDGVLHLSIPGLATWISQRKVGKQEASDSALLNDVPRATHDHRGYALLLQISRNQTHGLVADRSKRGEEYGIDAVLSTPFEDPRSGALQCPALAVIGRDPVEAW